MITRNEAIELAQAALPAWYDRADDDTLIVLPDLTKETPYAWVVYYTSKRWYETREAQYMLVGAGPFIISKHTGAITQYSSAYGAESALELYEEEQQLYGLRVMVDLSSMSMKLLLKKLLPLSNQELLKLVKEPAPWVARGSQARLKKLRWHLLSQGLVTELQPCF